MKSIKTRQFTFSPFKILVVLGDDLVDSEVPCLKQMIEVHLRLEREYSHPSVIALEKVLPEEVPIYGIVEGEMVEEGLYRIKRVVEKPSPEEAPSNLAIIGRYIFPPYIFEFLKRIPKSLDEYQLTDAI